MTRVKQRAPKGKDLTVFVRFGGLNLKAQKGYGDKGYHSPPAPRGIYAFPKVAQERFLLGSLESYQPGVMPKSPKAPQDPRGDYFDPDYPKPVDGVRVTEAQVQKYEEKLAKFMEVKDAFDWDAHFKRSDQTLSRIRREFVKTQGYIWHHLEAYCRKGAVLVKRNSWVKTSMADWRHAFSHASLADRYGMLCYWDWDLNMHVRNVKDDDDEEGLLAIISPKKIKSINRTPRFVGFAHGDCDIYEVFFDERV